MTNSDNVRGRGNLVPRVNAQGEVRITSGIVAEGSATDRDITFPGGVEEERFSPDSCVVAACGGANECTSANGRVVTASSIARKRLTPDSCVVGAYGVVSQRERSICSVAKAAGVAEKRCSTSGGVSICSVEQKRSSANTGVQVAGADGCKRKPANGCVISTAGKAKKGFLAFCGVATGVIAIRWRIDRVNFCQRPSADEANYGED